MIKTEKESSNYWYAYVLIGLLIGAVLGYYARQEGWLNNEAVGKLSKIRHTGTDASVCREECGAGRWTGWADNINGWSCSCGAGGI